jgi:Protein of unknown function DUF2625
MITTGEGADVVATGEVVRDHHEVAVREPRELIDVDDPVWPQLLELFDTAGPSVDVLELPDPAMGELTLARLAISAGSSLGALALHCAGLIVDDGWLRVLGGGGAGLPDLATVNGYSATVVEAGDQSPGRLLIAFDVLGGSFAVNRGGLDAGPDEICYFAPDSLTWLPLGVIGHSGFLAWALGGGLERTFEELRWPGWQDEARAARPDQAIAVHPPLWSAEGQDLGAAHRGLVPLAELLAGHRESADQLAGALDGEPIRVRIVDDLN